jgi:hypothetical protein
LFASSYAQATDLDFQTENDIRRGAMTNIGAFIASQHFVYPFL